MIIVFPAAGDGEYFVWKVRRELESNELRASGAA
jgi:hypothetical protein